MKNDIALSPGRIVGGKYCILRKVGEGGKGTVYQVRDLHLGKVWAMKWIAARNERQDLSVKELERMKILSHPRIPRIVDAFEIGQGVCIVMDFLEGKTLDKIFDDKTVRITEEDCVEWGIELCEALDYLHHLDPPMIYRDMKPGNVLIRPDRTAMLLDFGAVDGEGTPGYASPEQLLGKWPDERSDIYGLGRTLYRIRQAAERQRNKKLLTVLEKACEESPGRRFQSAAEMRKALEKTSSDHKACLTVFSGAKKTAAVSAAIGISAIFLVVAAASLTGEQSASAAISIESSVAEEKNDGNEDLSRKEDESVDAEQKKKGLPGKSDQKRGQREEKEKEKKAKEMKEADRYVELADQYSERNPRQALCYLEEASYLMEKNEEKEAAYDLMLRIFRMLLNSTSSNHSDEESKAQEYFQKLCDMKPDGWEPYLAYISYEYRSGRLGKAAELFRRASNIKGIEADPNYQSLKVKLENAGALSAE